MKRLWNMCGAVGFLGAVLLAGGCGGGSSSPSTVGAVTTPISGATVNTSGPNAGTVTTSSTADTIVTAPADAHPAVAAVTVTLPPSTTITAKDASGNTIALTAAPSFKFVAPANATTATSGTSGIPLPTTGGYKAVKSTVVAIDCSIVGTATSSFSNPITLNLPVPGKAPGSVVNAVYQNKNDGTGYKLIGGPYTVAANGTIAVTVTNLCWLVGDPEFETETGSSGTSGITS
ncbi:MAG TPA: hypothetical protein VF795_07435 [Desulfuromonadaceae bacterium]